MREVQTYKYYFACSGGVEVPTSDYLAQKNKYVIKQFLENYHKESMLLPIPQNLNQWKKIIQTTLKVHHI